MVTCFSGVGGPGGVSTLVGDISLVGDGVLPGVGTSLPDNQNSISSRCKVITYSVAT